TYPMNGEVVVNEDFLNSIETYFSQLLADVREQKNQIDFANAAKVKTGSADFTAGQTVATHITAILSNTSESYQQMEAKLNTIIGGVRYLRAHTGNAEEIAKMTAAELLRYLTTTGPAS